MTTEMRNGAACGSTVRPGCAETEQSVSKTPATYRPAVDIFEADSEYTIFVDLPGADRESIEVTAEGGSLTVEASSPSRFEGEGGSWLLREFGVGDYRRVFRLGEDVDTERIEASFTNGVLTITLPKAASASPRKISVQGD